MTREIAIETASIISQQDLATLVAEFGGGLQSPEIGFGIFYIQAKEGYMHVSLHPDILAQNEQEKDWIDLVTTKLGELPHGLILLSIGRNPGSDIAEIALRFCLEAVRRWGGGVDNLMAGEDLYVYTLPELEGWEQYNEGREFV